MQSLIAHEMGIIYEAFGSHKFNPIHATHTLRNEMFLPVASRKQGINLAHGGFRFLGRMPCCHVAMLLHVEFFGYSRRLSLHLRWWVDSLVAVLSDSNSILVSCTSLLCCASWCESSIDSKSGHASKYPCQWQTWIFAIVTCGERHGQPERATWKYPSKEIPKQCSSKTR